MSEYWVSKKKYFCKYCEIYIADDTPSRQQHENGLRHKGNTERFIRGLYKGSEKRKKDLDEEKRDMARVELAARAAFAQDVAAGHARGMSAPVASTSAAPRKPAPKPSNPYTNYSTAESLGYRDPDAERVAMETERRRTQGLAGDWEVVSAASLPMATLSDDNSPPDRVSGNLKREAEPPLDEDARQFKLRRKTASIGLGEIYDPGIIPVKTKKEDPDLSPVSSQVEQGESVGAPKWTAVQWKRPGSQRVEPDTNSADFEEAVAEEVIKVENLSTDGLGINLTPVIKSEETTSPGMISAGTMFRKRKTPAGGGQGRRQ